MLWNALIAHSVMKQAKLRSIGILAAVELFDAILKTNEEEAEQMDSATIESETRKHTSNPPQATCSVLRARCSLLPAPCSVLLCCLLVACSF